jgi:hypothetical protein
MKNMLIENSRALAIVTMIMSLPLFLSYNIKYAVFPEGLLFAYLFFWGLASVPLVPTLLLVEIVVLCNLMVSPNVRPGSVQVIYTLSAIFLATASIVVFLYVRSLSP